jgi:ATP-binding cassette subfamily B multidrug efflux pump
LLFSMMAHVVDCAGQSAAGATVAAARPVTRWPCWPGAAGQRGWRPQALTKYQGVFSNFPMRLRWNFHRLMLEQSMAFYQDEFAGRIATKVMQTALAVRDTWLILADILVYVVIYFVTLVAVVGSFDLWLDAALLGWLAAVRATLCLLRAAPGQGGAGAGRRPLSLMTGRITDAYTNIATVKLFSHGQREAGFAQGAMQEFMARPWPDAPGDRLRDRQPVPQRGAADGQHRAAALWLWMHGEVGVGAVAAATAMALRLNGISHWVMWEMASLFEHIGTVQDGMATLSARSGGGPRCQAAAGAARRDVLRRVRFAYGGAKPVVDGLDLTIRPGEKIGLVGRSGAGKSTVVNLLLRFYDLESAGRILIDGQDIAGVTQDACAAQVGMVTQDTSLLHRSVRDNILYGRPDASDARCARRRARRGA